MRQEWEGLSYHEIEPTNLIEGFLREVDRPENRNDKYLTGEFRCNLNYLIDWRRQ